MKTHIVIPVRDQLHLTKSICENLKTQIGWDTCWIFDNGSIDDTNDYLQKLWKEDRRFQYIDAPNYGIYEMWDKGFALAKQFGADYVAILNNDLELSKATIQTMANALAYNDGAWISYPDYNAQFAGPINYKVTSGTYRHGGMSGFCFMLKTAPIDWSPLVDPGIKLWYGDDDIAFEVEARGGRQVRVLGLPVVHIGQATTNSHPEVMESIPQDRVRFVEKWGNR